MTFQDLDNLTAAELKAQRADIRIDGAVPVQRYIDRLYDAKSRDEKLSEQGKLISTLQSGHDAAKAEQAELMKKLGQAGEEIAELQRVCRKNDETIQSLSDRLTSETARADRLKVECNRNVQIASAAEKAIHDMKAAQLIDAVENGE